MKSVVSVLKENLVLVLAVDVDHQNHYGQHGDGEKKQVIHN